VLSNVSGFTCASNMLPPGREVQAERPGTLPARPRQVQTFVSGVG
jgi:hypothetical protein